MVEVYARWHCGLGSDNGYVYPSAVQCSVVRMRVSVCICSWIRFRFQSLPRTKAKTRRGVQSSSALLVKTDRSWLGLLRAGAECCASLLWAFAYSV
jgi:hypothetical protein